MHMNKTLLTVLLSFVFLSCFANDEYLIKLASEHMRAVESITLKEQVTSDEWADVFILQIEFEKKLLKATNSSADLSTFGFDDRIKNIKQIYTAEGDTEKEKLVN